jgi:hypothetical protein
VGIGGDLDGNPRQSRIFFIVAGGLTVQKIIIRVVYFSFSELPKYSELEKDFKKQR